MAAVCVCALLLGGCAAPPGQSWRAERETVVGAVNETTENQAKLIERVEKLEKRLLELERRNKRQTARLKAVQSSLKTLLKSAIAKRSRQDSGAARVELVRRLDEIEATIREPIADERAEKTEQKEEVGLYAEAYLAFKSGRFDEAEAAFARLLATYPEGEYADQAHYWLGETHLAREHYDRAADSFSRVIDDYPDSAKRQAALFRLADTYLTAGRPGDAKAVWLRIARERPDTAAEKRARARIAELDAEEERQP